MSIFILGDVSLRMARRDEKEHLWRSIYIEKEWKMHDAPYYPLVYQSRFQFRRNLFKRLREAETAMIIDFQGEAVGYLSSYWEDQSSHWLEVGITIFTSKFWSQHIGRKALTLWISHLFQQTDVARIGLSTWSGNPRMMKCAEALGMKQEGCMRNVRFFEEKYYDSLSYGVLREEWETFKTTSSRV